MLEIKDSEKLQFFYCEQTNLSDHEYEELEIPPVDSRKGKALQEQPVNSGVKPCVNRITCGQINYLSQRISGKIQSYQKSEG